MPRMSITTGVKYDLDEALRTLSWSRAELARRLGVHRNTVSGWTELVPGYAVAYLGLATGIKRLGV